MGSLHRTPLYAEPQPFLVVDPIIINVTQQTSTITAPNGETASSFHHNVNFVSQTVSLI